MKKSNINIVNRQKKISSISQVHLKKQLLVLFDFADVDGDRLDIFFVAASEIRKIHKYLFNDPTLTDVITIPIDRPSDRSSGYCHLGEIYICPSVAHSEAKKRKISFEEELTLYLIHGFLHLLGFKDSPPKEKKRMRKKEKFLMTLLKEKQLL